MRQGEFFGLVGVNGAGKTTCIKSLLDFTSIDTGSVEIFGVHHRETRARAQLAFLPERFLPPYYLSGRDFLGYMGRLHGRITDDQERRATAMADRDLCAAITEREFMTLERTVADWLDRDGAEFYRSALNGFELPKTGAVKAAELLTELGARI